MLPKEGSSFMEKLLSRFLDKGTSFMFRSTGFTQGGSECLDLLGILGGSAIPVTVYLGLLLAATLFLAMMLGFKCTAVLGLTGLPFPTLFSFCLRRGDL